jgi:hypothetical protein
MDKEIVGNEEPPSCGTSDCNILVGKDREGHWVVKDQAGLHGGIFVDRAQALKYAMRDIADRMQAVIMVPGILELDWGGPQTALARHAPARARMSRAA